MNRRINNILFIDDDQIIGLVTKRLLEQMEAAEEVHTISDSLLAFAHIKELYQSSSHSSSAGADLIFLDLEMPGMGGFALLDKLLALKEEGALQLENTFFVLITSMKGDKEVEKAATYPVLGIYEKPLSPLQIEGIIDKIAVITPAQKSK